jgi:hypothetical protein
METGGRRIVMHTDRHGKNSSPRFCNLCNEEHDILFVKPKFMKVNNNVFTSNQIRPLWVCLGCFMDELDRLKEGY